MNFNFRIFDPIFRKFGQKTPKVRKKSNFRKSDFWCQKRASRVKITTGWYFLAKKSKKKRFFKNFENFAILWFFHYKAKSGLAEGLVPEDSPHIKLKDMKMLPLENSFWAGTARPGTLWWYGKENEFCAFLSLVWLKSISDFLF